MPPPSALSIKTSSVIRLIKEEASYHKEAVAQEKVIEKLEKGGGDEYELRQQVRLPRLSRASITPLYCLKAPKTLPTGPDIEQIY